MQTWRMLELQTDNAYMNMSIDEAIMAARIAEKVPNTLRFYRWNPSSISFGKNQNPEAEVYVENCRRLGVDLVRRVSGGGTVYHDFEGEVTYSVVAKVEDLGSADVTSVYAKIYEAIKDALRLLGITADFGTGDAKNCPNMTVSGKKISGSSQSISRAVVLQHGTVLRKVDLPKMFTLLKLRNVDCAQAADIAKRKITSIQDELGHGVEPETVANALLQGFRAMMRIQLEKASLTPFEINLSNTLCKEKYATPEWNFEDKVS